MRLIVMWQWADGASAARESVYFHKSRRSINTEGWLWGWPFPCQVCRVFESGTDPVLFCNQTRYSLSSSKDSPHYMSTRPFKLGNWVERNKKKKHRKSPWLEVDRRTSSSKPEQGEETRLVLQKQSLWTCLRNLSWHATSPTRYLSAPSCKIMVYHLTRPWITATNGLWLRRQSEEKVSQCWAVIRFLKGLWRASQVTPQLSAGVVCLSLRQTWLSRHRGHSVIHPPPLPVFSPFSLKCLCYLAQSITCVKTNGCVWREDSTAEGGREGRGGAVRWVSGTGGQGQSLSHLGSSSPSALDRLTCIHPPAQEGPRAHTYTE